MSGLNQGRYHRGTEKTENGLSLRVFSVFSVSSVSLVVNIIADLKRCDHQRISLVVWLGIAASFGYLLSVSWLTWGDLIVDTGTDLWVPTQLLQGKALYTDVFYEFGFFPPYFLAFLYRIFGIQVYTLIGCGIGVTISMCVALYKIARFFLDQVVSGLVVITFLFVFAFGNYAHIFNFILPYSFAAVFYILFLSAALYCFLRFILFDQESWLLGWIFFVVLAFCSRVEMTFPVWGGFTLIGAVQVLKYHKQPFWKYGVYFGAPVFISLLSYGVFFGEFLDYVSKRILIPNQFNRSLAGLAHFSQQGLSIGKSLGLHLLLLVLIGISSMLLARALGHPGNRVSLLLCGGTLVSAFYLAFHAMRPRLQYKSLPVILLLGIVMTLCNLARADQFKLHLARLTIFLIALLTMLRTFFNPDPVFYGFYLLDLGIICYYLFFFQMLKPVILRYFGNFPWTIFSVLLGSYFLLCIGISWAISFYWGSQKNIEITTDRGTLFCRNDIRTKRFWEAVSYLRDQTSPNSTLAVFPIGVALNFFSLKENPAGYYMFSPPPLHVLGEQHIITRLAQAKVDYIALLRQDTSEDGYASFGKDYGKELYAWILNNYRLVKEIGPYPFTTDEFGVAIFKKKTI